MQFHGAQRPDARNTLAGEKPALTVAISRWFRCSWRQRVAGVLDEDVVKRGVGPVERRFELVGRAASDDLTVTHDGDALAEAIRLLHVVRGQKDRHAGLRAQVGKAIPDGAARHGIEAGCRLVEEEQPWLVEQGLRDLQTANHAAGVGARQPVARIGKPHVRQRLADTRLAIAVRPGGHRGRRKDQKILVAGQAAVRRERLWHVADDTPDLARLAHEVEAIDLRRTRGRRQERRQHLERRRFARAIGAEQAEDLPFFDAQYHIVHRRHRAEAFGQSLYFENRAHHRPSICLSARPADPAANTARSGSIARRMIS